MADNLTVEEKLERGDYSNKMEYPKRPPRDKHTPEADESFRQARRNYQAENYRLEAMFKADALADVGLTNHPKADKAYAMAWEHGHASGLSEVLYWLRELAELLDGVA